MKTNLEIRHDKDDLMWYVYDKTDDNHEYIFDYFSDVNRWVKEFYKEEVCTTSGRSQDDAESEREISCCGIDITDNDIKICPECKEHC